MAKFQTATTNAVAAAEKKSFTMSTEDKIRRGQAYNLAVSAAISEGKATDKKEIFAFFTFYYDLGKLCQTYSMDEIRELLK